MKTKVNFQFERRHIERGEFQILLDAFDAERMTPEGLAQYCGTVKIQVSGYDNRDERPFRVPELRTFLQALGKRWRPGAAAFFCDVHSAFFNVYLTSQLTVATVVERDLPNDYFVQCRAAELGPVLDEACQGIAEYGARAGMTQSAVERRQQQLIHEVLIIFKFK
jgi:hypothetical protein